MTCHSVWYLRIMEDVHIDCYFLTAFYQAYETFCPICAERSHHLYFIKIRLLPFCTHVALYHHRRIPCQVQTASSTLSVSCYVNKSHKNKYQIVKDCIYHCIAFILFLQLGKTCCFQICYVPVS